jgi:hypothetical protein
MKNYRRRQDFSDLPRGTQLGILQTELELAETPEEIANAKASIKRMEEVIERFKPKEAPPGGLAMNPTHDEYNR